MTSRTPRLLSLSAALVLSLVVGACGGSESSSGGDDPASLAPARAPVYVEAVLKPDGQALEDFNAIAKKLSGEDDPGKALRDAFEKDIKEDDPSFSYARDVEPWLGERVGLFVTNVSPGSLISTGGRSGAGADADAAIIAPTEDVDKARDLLEKTLRRGGDDEPTPKVVEKTYRDVKYSLDQANDDALAFIGDVAVVGTDGGVRAAIDASEGEKLSDADAFKKARDEVPDEDGLAFMYVRPQTLLSSFGPQGAVLQPLFASLGDTIAMSLGGDEDQIDVDGASIGGKSGDVAAGPGSVLETVPSDAWLAAGSADLGGQLNRTLEQVSSLGSFAGVDAQQVLEQFRKQTGLDVKADLIDWMGDAAIFVRGESMTTIGGAVVVQSKDPAVTGRAIPKIVKLLRSQEPGLKVSKLNSGGVDVGFTLQSEQLPVPLHIALVGDKFVAAVGDPGLEGVTDAPGPLSDKQSFKDADERLGDDLDLGFFLDVPPVAELIRGFGAGDDPEARKFLEGLSHLTTISAGTKREDDVTKFKVATGVK